jgi:hypothetical protein
MEGSVYEGEERVITFRAATFQLVMEKVRDMAGSQVSHIIFHQLGIASSTAQPIKKPDSWALRL